jgi:hypothetical protein
MGVQKVALVVGTEVPLEVGVQGVMRSDKTEVPRCVGHAGWCGGSNRIRGAGKAGQSVSGATKSIS